MRTPTLVLALLALAPLASAACQTKVCTAYEAPVKAENNTAPEGFVSLFDGKVIDTAVWTGGTTHNPAAIAAQSPEKKAKWFADKDAEIAKHWSADAAKGEIVSDGHGAHLATRKHYADFEFRVDYKIRKNGDSGIYLRGCPQVQIWDPSNPAEQGNGAAKGSGGMWNNNGDNPGRWPLVLADSPIGEWNTLHIVMVGQRVWVTLNGKVTINGSKMDNLFDRKAGVPAAESIHLQTHGNEVRFRNVFVREIGAEEGAKHLAAVKPEADAPVRK